MKRLAGTMAAAALLVLPAAAQGQESFKIKSKDLAKGQTIRQSKVETMVQKFKLADINGKEMEGKDENSTTTTVFQETIVELPDPKGQPTRLKRIYEKAEVKTPAGTKVLPLQGKTVVIDYKDNKYEFQYENGGALSDEDAEHLKKDFEKKDDKGVNIEKLFMPSDTLKVGETWKLPVSDLLKVFGIDKRSVDEAKCVSMGKFVRTYKEEGSTFGEFQIKIDYPLKMIPTDNLDVVFDPGAVLFAEINVKGCIDGSRSTGDMRMTMQMKGNSNIPAENPVARMTMLVEVTASVAVEELPAK